MQLAHDKVGLKIRGPFCNLFSRGRLDQDTVTYWVRENRWLEGRSHSCAYPTVWAEYPRCLREKQKPPGEWQALTVPMRLQWASRSGVKHHGWSAAGGKGKSQSTGSSQNDDWAQAGMTGKRTRQKTRNGMNLSLIIKQRHRETGHFLKTSPLFDKAASLSQELQGVWHCVNVLRQRGCRHPRSELRNAGGM